ncbi:hypothetical protein LTR56_023593 [Elasticomyces elasticus]|nr:hypothetical protein LTR56_023593 [Elasticomyces elasticus]KAK3662401.1 hypothetical protein LTR22_006680 [Elasticomyces elasticus]KAK4926390.1 hypothetical protein LTR49_006597 [Elasticomyces elasticus]KAK5761237.1 hypothetical protein LTS12_008718 [Elasticomyces elasticus]
MAYVNDTDEQLHNKIMEGLRAESASLDRRWQSVLGRYNEEMAPLREEKMAVDWRMAKQMEFFERHTRSSPVQSIEANANANGRTGSHVAIRARGDHREGNPVSGQSIVRYEAQPNVNLSHRKRKREESATVHNADVVDLTGGPESSDAESASLLLAFALDRRVSPAATERDGSVTSSAGALNISRPRKKQKTKSPQPQVLTVPTFDERVAEAFPMVVPAPIGEGYLVLLCALCKGNYSLWDKDKHTKHPYNGVAGFTRHIAMAHADQRGEHEYFEQSSVVEACTYKRLTKQEVAAMLADEPGAYKIEMVVGVHGRPPMRPRGTGRLPDRLHASLSPYVFKSTVCKTEPPSQSREVSRARQVEEASDEDGEVEQQVTSGTKGDERGER